MGITILDTIEYDIGVTLANTYGSFAKNSIVIHANDDDDDDTYDYYIHGRGQVWASKAKRDEEDSPILDVKNINIGITSGQLDTNLYVILYDNLKSQYISTIDDLE